MKLSWLMQRVRLLSVIPLALLFLLLLRDGVPADRPHWVSQAEERLRKGDYEGALKAFQQAAWQRPQDANLHYNMGVLAESLGRLGESVEHYMAYLRWSPQAADREKVRRKVFQLCGELAAEAYRNRQYLLALDWYQRGRELYPYAKAVHFNLSRVYEAMGEWERAASSLQEYHALCSPSERGAVKKRIAGCLHKAAERRFEEGDYDGALARYQEAARWDDEDFGLLLNQALCEEKLGLYEAAKNHYLAYLQVDAMSRQRDAIRERIIHLHVLLAEDHLNRGYFERAQDVLDQGLEIDSENPAFYRLAARASLGLGQEEQAVAYLERILEVVPDETDRVPYVNELVRLCISLADPAYRDGDYPKASRFLKKALYWDSENPLVAYNLAKVYERQEEWEQAVLAYRRYLYLDPDAVERNEVKAKLAYYYYFLGTERFEKGEYPQAQEAFEQALLVRPEDPALLYNLATVLLKRGKTGEALHFLERYLQNERDPEQIERVQRQVTQLVSLTEQRNRRKRGRSVSSSLAALEESRGYREDDALAERKKGYLLLQAGRWQEAMEQYQECLRRVPSLGTEEGFQKELASAYREVSRRALVEGKLGEALETLERARLWAPTEAFPYLWKGKVYEHRGDTGEALKIYRESLRYVRGEQGRRAIRNRIVALLTQRLQIALRKEDFSDALSAMSALEPYLEEGQARDVHYQKARIEGAVGRKEEALVNYGLHLLGSSQLLLDFRIREELSTLIQDDPDLLATLDDPSEAYRKGMEWSRRGEHAKALFCFFVARSDSRSPPDLDSEIVRTLDRLGMSREAVGILSRSLEGGKPLLVPSDQAVRMARSAEPALWEDYRRGNYERGLERVRGIQAQLTVPNESLLLLEGVFEDMVGRYENAIERYEEALKRGAALPHQQIAPVRQRLCSLLIRKALGAYDNEDYEICLEFLRRAEETVPGRADVAFDLGCVYLRLKNPRRALEAFSRYLEIVQEESPRKQLTTSAIHLLQSRLARSPVVRYDGEDITVDLIFERPISLGDLLAGERSGDERDELLDSVVLAPYLDSPPGGEELDLL